MKIIAAALVAIPLVGCLQGQESFDVSDTQTVSFPGLPPAAVQAFKGASGTTESHVRIDLRKQLAALGGEPLGAAFTENGLSGSALALVEHVHATISVPDGSMPDVVWSDDNVPADSTEIQLQSTMSGDQLLKYLEAGPVDVHFVLTGTISPEPVSLTHTLRGHMTVAVDGPVTKL